MYACFFLKGEDNSGTCSYKGLKRALITTNKCVLVSLVLVEVDLYNA